MSTSFIDAEARVKMLRKALTHLCDIYPETIRTLALFEGQAAKTWAYAIVGRLITHEYVERVHIINAQFECRANVEKAQVLINSNELLSEILWPKKNMQLGPSTDIPPELPPPTELPLPPPIEGLPRPPEGASFTMIQEWIFTLLHAQTENIIYLRERLDRALVILETFV